MRQRKRRWREKGGTIVRTRAPDGIKKAAFADSVAGTDEDGEILYRCGREEMSSTIYMEIQAECDGRCDGHKLYRKKDVQLCHKWACFD
jgi:hypothetical protein